jgi:hypothetical protein
MKRIMGFSGDALSEPMGYYSFWSEKILILQDGRNQFFSANSPMRPYLEDLYCSI